MATIAVGDIHGNRAALADLLAKVRPLMAPADTVVFLGDYIDRGTDSKGCVQEILEFRSWHRGEVVCLAGNHEDWFCRAMRNHTDHAWLLGMDGYATIRSYSAEAEQKIRAVVREAGERVYERDLPLPYDALVESMPPDHVQFFAGLVRLHHDRYGIYVHAGLDPGRSLGDQSRETVTLGWDDGGFPETYRGETTVLYGHRNNAELDTDRWPHPKRIGNTIGLDTSRHGVVTALRLPDQRLIQSGRFIATRVETQDA